LEVDVGPFHVGVSACGVSKSAWRGSWRKRSVLEELIHAGEDSDRKLGDDAFAFCVAPSSQVLVGAVADGVGGWRERGDPAYVSHQLMALVRREVSSLAPDHGPVSAFNVLSTAYKNLKAKPRDENGKEYAGSTTAVVGVVQYDPVPARLSFNAINVGDSSLVIVRGNKEAMMEVTRHGSVFSAPTQLALIPQAMQGQGFCDDRPEDGVIDKGDLERGDVLIFASDGVLDNLEVHTIGEIVRRSKESKGTHARSAGEISRALLLESQRGPKVDDMTVLVLAIDK
jgi:protein phosphatase PTC7